jgi:hypothetical protein
MFAEGHEARANSGEVIGNKDECGGYLRQGFFIIVWILARSTPTSCSLAAVAFAARLRWMSTALRTASTTLLNSVSIPSPVFLTTRPRCFRHLAIDEKAQMRLDAPSEWRPTTPYHSWLTPETVNVRPHALSALSSETASISWIRVNFSLGLPFGLPRSNSAASSISQF